MNFESWSREENIGHEINLIMRHKRYSTSDMIKLEGFITLQETQAYITVDGTLTRAHLEYIIIIIITCNLKYSECFGKKRWTRKLERTKQLLVFVTTRVTHVCFWSPLIHGHGHGHFFPNASLWEMMAIVGDLMD